VARAWCFLVAGLAGLALGACGVSSSKGAASDVPLAPFASKSGEVAKARVFVLKSKGVCDGCAEAISKMLFTERIPSQIVGPEQLKSSVGPRDAVVIGGSEPDADGEWTVKQDLMRARAFQWLKDHIYNGGRYVGICSGAYLTEAWIDQASGIRGLDIFPGRVANYSLGKKSQYVKTRWSRQGRERFTYFQDGPAFYPDPGAAVDVLGTFAKDGTIAAAVFPYGAGKVGVLSPHLEADKAWGDQAQIRDPDGLDYDLGIAAFRRVLD